METMCQRGIRWRSSHPDGRTLALVRPVGDARGREVA